MAQPAQKQATPGTPSTDDSVKSAGLKRLAPESTGLLDKIDQKLKEQESNSKDLKRKKRQILERCGCL